MVNIISSGSSFRDLAGVINTTTQRYMFLGNHFAQEENIKDSPPLNK